MRKIKTPLERRNLKTLRAGEEVLLSGTIYTARDQAHKRLSSIILEGRKMPLKLEGLIIYHCGPVFRKDEIISCGPTTSSRLDIFSEPLLKAGIRAFIGKGRRASFISVLLKKYQALYFVAPAGCGAYLAEKVVSSSLILFKDLGPEGVYRLEVKDFPLIVAVDTYGNDIYGRLKDGYKK